MKPWLSTWRPLVGGVAWLAAVSWLRPSVFETGWAVAVLLLSPLVLVPLGLFLVVGPDPNAAGSRLLHLADFLQLPSALILASAFTQPAGWLAAALALPWLVTTAVIALAGLVRLGHRRSLCWEEICLDAGLVYLVVGGGWAVLSRAGLRPLNFEAVIVLLTAIHFHFAGFLLPVLTGLAGRALRGFWSRAAALGVVAGVPLVATGITATQLGFGPWLECLAACLLALAGLATAGLHLRLAAQTARPRRLRLLWAVASLSLASSMALAGLYGCRFYLPVAWLDIPWMRALHGTANALGFGLAGTLAWGLEKRLRR